MTNQIEIQPQQTSGDSIDPKRVAYLRIMNDLIIIVFTLFLVIPVVNMKTTWVVILSTFGILISSLLGFILIYRGRPVYGLGLLIYGLNFGLFVNSFLIEGWGFFSLFIITIFTLLSVSTSIPQKRAIEGIITGMIIGIASVLVDINLKDASFRIGVPAKLLPFQWMIAAAMLIIFGIIIYRQIRFFSLRTKLISSFAILTIFSIGILGLLLHLSFNSVLNEEVAESLIHSTILYSIVSGVVTIVIAVGFTQILTLPIRRLIDFSKEISHGNLETEFEVTSSNELGVLSNTYINLANRLKDLNLNFEDQVATRVLDLEDRVTKVQIAAEVARDTLIESERINLLNRAVTLLSERYDFYHVGIYLIDSKDEFAILVAGNDVIGEQLVASQHKYRIASDSNVGTTCLTGEALIAPNEEANTQISYHPLLTNTSSQMVLPLHAGDKILGAIDLHSTNPEAFQQSDIPIYQITTDLLAIAIQKIEHREEIQRALQEQEKSYGLYTRESWRRFIQGKGDIKGYRYSVDTIEQATSIPPEVIEAWTTKEVVSQEISQLDNDEINGTSNLTIPLKIREEVIGVLNLQIASNQVPTDLNNFIQELANRFSLVLENARLVEVAQRRVERERITGEITNKIRQTLDFDSVLRTAVKEIGEVLDLAEVEVQMGESFTTLSDDNRNPERNKTESNGEEA